VFLNLKNMMKKLVIVIAVPFLLASCLKSKTEQCAFQPSSAVAPAAEVNTLQGWISANRSAAIKDPSGFFYEITNSGSGATASVCSAVTVKYSGTLLNGSKFDENLTGFTEALGRLIVGWQKGIPLIKAGGSINLYIPPSLGYGSKDVTNNSGAVIIPANSNLIFNVQLISVQ
jgi:FKBP-type peptidyl-prolyl cis-trans isomerase FkpA